MRKLCPIVALALLSACASPASMANLTAAQQNYAASQAACAHGDQYACAQLPMMAAFVNGAQAQVGNEQATSAAIGLGALAVGLSAVNAATCCNYHYYYRGWRHY